MKRRLRHVLDILFCLFFLALVWDVVINKNDISGGIIFFATSFIAIRYIVVGSIVPFLGGKR